MLRWCVLAKCFIGEVDITLNHYSISYLRETEKLMDCGKCHDSGDDGELAGVVRSSDRSSWNAISITDHLTVSRRKADGVRSDLLNDRMRLFDTTKNKETNKLAT
jgi:hypothetical protein